jgi:hypothetical protein
MGELGMFVCFRIFLSECDGIRHAKEETRKRREGKKKKRMNCKTSFALAPSRGKEKERNGKK